MFFGNFIQLYFASGSPIKVGEALFDLLEIFEVFSSYGEYFVHWYQILVEEEDKVYI